MAQGASNAVTGPIRDYQPHTLVGLPALMERTAGVASVVVALIDGPVWIDHPDLARGSVRLLSDMAICRQPNTAACRHGTLVAGVMHARRDSRVPGICPECTLLVQPIFSEPGTMLSADCLPGAAPAEAAAAILQAIDAGARIINLSVGLVEQGPGSERAVEQALDAAAQHHVLVVAAAGNQGLVGSSPITRHPWVIPVVAFDRWGRVMPLSNLGTSIGARGLAAPGEDIESLAADPGTARFSGTSAAVPFVTGTLALLWSLFPTAGAVRLRHAIAGVARRRTITPPMLNAHSAHRALAQALVEGPTP